MTPDTQAQAYAPRQDGAASALSMIFGREPARFQVDDAVLTMGFAAGSLASVQKMCGGEPLARLEWLLDGVASELLLPASVVTRLVAPLEETPDGALDWDTAPMLLELLLAPYLDQAETLVGKSCRFQRLERGTISGAVGHLAGVALHGSLDGAPFASWLSLAPSAVEAVARLARLLPAGRQLTPDPPVVVSARVGLARLGVQALASVQVGDAVLIEEGPLQNGRVMVVVGERRAALARRTGTAVTLEQPLQPAGAFEAGEWTMQDEQECASVEATFGDLRVTLVFELGRRLATLDEVRGLAPGQVLGLGRDEAAPVDILANGARLGRGEIVKIGDALAVRIIGLHGHD